MHMYDMNYTRTNNPVKFIGVGWIPAALGVSIAAASLISFVWAVLAGDVTVFVPFISEAGADPPQSGFFSLMILISCIWSGVTMMIRYSIVRQLLRLNQGECLNACALGVGFLSIFGLAIVAAYPLTSNNKIHDLGAALMFFCGVVYCIMQSILSAWMHPWHNGMSIIIIRGIITTIAAITGVSTAVCQVTAKRLWSESGIQKPEDMRVPGDPAFSWFTAASVSEWITVAMFVIYFFSFIREFKKVVLELDTYPLVDHFDDDIEIRLTTSENMPLYKSVL